MSTISIRLPESIHTRIKVLAKRENISINQLITTALAEKLSALDTEEYLKERARSGDRSKFEKALSKIADAEPDECDRL
jgi:predicted transcriptional regulator